MLFLLEVRGGGDRLNSFACPQFPIVNTCDPNTFLLTMTIRKPHAPFKPSEKKLVTLGSNSSSASAKKLSHRQSLAAQLAEFTNPTPKDFDPEDEDGITGANNTKGEYDYEVEEDSVPRLMR